MKLTLVCALGAERGDTPALSSKVKLEGNFVLFFQLSGLQVEQLWWFWTRNFWQNVVMTDKTN